MSKKLNEDVLGSELRASAFFVGAQSTKTESSPTPPDEPEPVTKNGKVIPRPPINIKMASEPKEPDKVKVEEKPVDQPDALSTTKSTSQSTDRQVIDQTKILGRPKAFYITEKQDRDLDTLVAQISIRLGGKLLFKIDRSVLIRLILESSDLTSDQTVERLSARLVSRSISQLTG